MRRFQQLFAVLLGLIVIGIPRFSSATEPPTQEQLVEAVQELMPKSDQNCIATAVPLIAQALSNRGILSREVLAYAYATTEHETQYTFCPLAEVNGEVNAKKFGYDEFYYGRGYIQLTHLYNYEFYGKLLGVDLAGNPRLALEPETAANVLAEFFKQSKTAKIIEAGRDGFLERARKSVSGDTQPAKIGKRYNDFVKTLPSTEDLVKLFPAQKLPERISRYGG